MNKLLFIMLQSIAGDLIGYLLVASVIILFSLAVFLIIRGIVLWYWKVDVIVRNQEAQTTLLKYQNDLIEYQTEVLKDLKAQLGNNRIDPNNEALRP